MPTVRQIADIKSKLLHPALTSHFEVKIPIPPGLSDKYLIANGLGGFATVSQDRLQLMCSEALLPGSALGTMDISGDYHGVTQKHATRRIYDDRIDLTFYVDADNYIPIRYFETWIKYIVGESIASSNGRPGSENENYFYRLNYPKNYICKTGLEVVKFERTGDKDRYTGKSLVYKFVNSFPIAITSMPVSYEASSLLKCTVSFSYIRYLITPTSKEPEHEDSGDTNDTSSSSLAADSPYKFTAPDFLLNPKFGVQESPNDFLNIGNPALDQFGNRDAIGRPLGQGTIGTVGATISA